MQIRCPVCDYSREANLAKVPSTAEFATCPKCRHRFRFRAVDLDAVEQSAPPEPKPEHTDVWDAVDSLHNRWTDKNDANGEEEASSCENAENTDIPWENPSDSGYLRSFLRTTLWILLQPASFFPALSRRPTLIPAFAYYMIFGMIKYVFNVVWTHVLGVMLRDRMVENIGEEMYMRIAGNVLKNSLFSPAVLSVPFQLAIQLVITAAMIHFLVRIVSPQDADFNLSFKVVSYASAGFAFLLLPVLGVLIGPVVYFALLFIGCRNAFSMSWSKTLAAMLPLLLLLLFAASSQYSSLISGI